MKMAAKSIVWYTEGQRDAALTRLGATKDANEDMKRGKEDHMPYPDASEVTGQKRNTNVFVLTFSSQEDPKYLTFKCWSVIFAQFLFH